MTNRKVVTMAVDNGFFKNVFEPARKRAKSQLGLEKLSQRNFTKMIDQSGMNLNIKFNMGGKNAFNAKRKKR